MVYICAIPQRVPGARRTIPPAAWAGFRTDLEAQLPVETRLEFVEPTPTRQCGWVFWARPRADAVVSDVSLHALYHDVSNRIDEFLSEHSTSEPGATE
jgi:hypothetical protein